MYAQAVFGCVQAQAGLGLSVVGDLRALLRLDPHVGFAGGDHLNAARPEQRPQTHAERESEGLFELIVGKASARVVAAVGRVENHDKTSLWSGWGRLRGGHARKKRPKKKTNKEYPVKGMEKSPNFQPCRQKATSGAKARFNYATLTARLKSCPFITRLIQKILSPAHKSSSR